MVEGVTTDLLRVTCIIGLFGFLVSRLIISVEVAFITAILKVMIPFIYFAYYYDGSWNFLDDITYTAQGTRLLDLGYNPITTLVNEAAMSELINLSRGYHIIYGWWNVFAQYLFGKHYYSAVFLNVALTFVIGHFLVKIAHMSNFDFKYRQKLYLFYLLQWELLTWSSLMNMKDILIMTLTIIALYLILKLSELFSVKHFVFLVAIGYLFFYIRFYIPLLLLASTVIWVSLFQNNRRKYYLIGVVIAGLFFSINYIGIEDIRYYFSEALSFENIFISPFRMLSLTPQPWSLHEKYTFLFIPSILNLLFFLPTLWGGLMLFGQSKKVRLLLIYLSICLLLYGNFPGQDGPRHRVQLIFIIIWMQFHFLLKILGNSKSNSSKLMIKPEKY